VYLKHILGVVVEQDHGGIKPVSFEMINAARELADKISGKVIAFCLSHKLDKGGERFIENGADEVRFLKHPDLEIYSHENYSFALRSEIEKIQVDYLFLAATNNGKELSAVLSAQMGVGVATDCISLSVFGDNEIEVVRPVSSGKALSTVRFQGKKPYIVTLRPNVFRNSNFIKGGTGNIITENIELPEFSHESNDLVMKMGSQMDITEARIIVSGGLGMQGPENFKLLEELAEVLGGAVGASRPVVDNGWREYSNQVGQTGRTVSPDIYIACGISGAVQHLAGMSSSRCIVAINSDPHAPIFSVADYGIIGNVLNIIPILTRDFNRFLSS
jgi:electron transfer flavoprotein alpha subunit